MALTDAERQAAYRLRNPYKLKTTDIVVNGKKYTIANNALQPKAAKALIKFLNALEKNPTLENALRLKQNQPKYVTDAIGNYGHYLRGDKKGAFLSGKGNALANFFDELKPKLPKKATTFLEGITGADIRRINAITVATPASAKTVIGNPLVTPIIDFIKNNPDATESEFFKNIRKTSGKQLSNSEIIKAAVRAHGSAFTRLLREGRKEEIGENQLKALKNFKSDELANVSKTLINLFPVQIGRDFSGTITEFYKDNPTLKKRALDKLKAYGSIRKQIQDTLDLGGKGKGRAAFQFDHPISFAALERSGDIEGAVRTNPISGDVNQFKSRLDIKLNNLQRAIMSGKNVDQNIMQVEKLKNINQTLFGKLAGDFSINEKGIIKVKDYGAPKLLDTEYDIARSLQKNLPLGGKIKSTLASGKLTPQLTELLGETSAKSLIASSQKLIEFSNKNINDVCKIFGRSNRAEGGIGCAGQMAEALDNDPVGTANKIKDLKVEGGAVNRIKGAASAFLKFAGKGKVFGVTAAVGVGAGALVKEFRNDDPDTYLSNENQMKGMLVDTFEEDTLGKASIGGELAAAGLAAPGSAAVYGARRLPFTDATGKTRAAMGPLRSALGPLGKAASGFATPLGMGLTLPFQIASQLREGDSLEDIATSPLNYLAPAFAGTLTKEATRGMNPTGLLAKGLRLGMSPAGVRGISKFFGLPGLALSLGYEGYDQYKKYQEGEGFLYNLLNKDD